MPDVTMAGVVAGGIAPMPAVITPEGRPCWYPPDAILTPEEAGAVLGVHQKTLAKYRVRRSYLSRTEIRYFYRDLVAYMEARAVAA